VELSVVHARQPLYIQMSNGMIENKYTIKALNKTSVDRHFQLHVEGVAGIHIVGDAGADIVLESGKMVPFHIFLEAQPAALKGEKMPLRLVLESVEPPAIKMEYDSVFIGPAVTR